MYTYGQEFFEVQFPVDCFLHLTGVDTNMRAKDFYQKAKDGKLNDKQFFFSAKHTMRNALKKVPCLIRLPELTNTMVCIVKGMMTLTFTYTIGVTNLEFTLGLSENLDTQGNKINDMFIPRSLRVNDDAIDISRDGEIVDFIFAREASEALYKKVSFADTSKTIPSEVFHLIDSALIPSKGINGDEDK